MAKRQRNNAPRASPPPPGQPSHAFQQHHDVLPPDVSSRSFRQHWRITSRLDKLHRDGKISQAQFLAATSYRNAWERVMRANSPPTLGMRVSGSAGSNTSHLDAVTDDISHIREAETAIGNLRTFLCFACAVEDTPWTSTAKFLHIDRETARDWTALAIHALERAWRGATRRPAGGALGDMPTEAARRVARS